jgi:hypothetical protein
MMRRGEPLGAVAAALASPETAVRIAVLEAATSGGMSALQAARLTVARAGGDTGMLDGLHAQNGLHAQDARHAQPLRARTPSPHGAHGEQAVDEVEDEGVASSGDPFALSQNGSRSRS